MRCVRINRVFEIWYDKKNLFIYEEIKKIKRKRSFPNSETGSTREYNSWLPIFDKKKKKEKKSTVCQPRRSSNLSARCMDASLHRNRINLHCVARWTSSWDIYVCIALSYLPNNWAGWSHDEKNTLLDEIVEKCPSLAVEFLFIFLKRYLPSMLIDPRKFYRYNLILDSSVRRPSFLNGSKIYWKTFEHEDLARNEILSLVSLM